MTANSILITGASSGIGAALAQTYAAPGVRLVLWGRNQDRLRLVAEQCRARGSVVETDCFDLTGSENIVERLAAAESAAPIDLAIFNAGVGGSLPTTVAAPDPDVARNMANVNFVAPIIGASVIAASMAKRGRGRIVLIGSIAESFPLPMAPVYAGTKAGLAMFANALRLRLRRHGVGVTLVSPGFIDTPMSRSLSQPKPFLMMPERAAALIARNIERGRRSIVVPWQFAAIRTLTSFIPRSLVDLILSRI